MNGMRFLIVTNLYPPQELGGYGRSMADFAWGLLQSGHHVEVLTSDAPYLQADESSFSGMGPSGEMVDRRLMLKGSYQHGVTFITEASECVAINRANQCVVSEVLNVPWDGILLGNIDLFGPELLYMLNSTYTPILHHMGFMDPPFPKQYFPQMKNYTVVTASQAVRSNLQIHGLPVTNAPVVYPGVRSQLFGDSSRALTPALRFCQALQLSGHPLGTRSNPLKVGYAGLLMGTKGVHTLIEALVLLHRHGVVVQACLAGSEFQPGYEQLLQNYIDKEGLNGQVLFVGHLGRSALSKFWNLQHVGVFSSIYPEAFGIVAAELMAAGAALVTSAVGGAAELVPSERYGMRFNPGQSNSLASVLHGFVKDPQKLFHCAKEGQLLVRSRFDVLESARQLERLFCQRRAAR